MSRVRVAWMMAICICESGGNGYAPRGSQVIVDAMKRLTSLTGIGQSDFLLWVMQREGLVKSAVPKFRFEPTWYEQLKQKSEFDALEPAQKATLACSWGIAQQAGLYLSPDDHPLDQLTYCKHFMYSEEMQLARLVHNLGQIEAYQPDAGALRFTRYNAGLHTHRINDYGSRAANIAYGFERAIETGGLRGCLDLTHGPQSST